ncbi:hypothetical protein LX73_0826 [Fodinibius salinus]|uniref:Uncharacterized protein n=1 Tax=Fodinibius salinus TaxID=860790 RepID=A0A5D3YQZ7_9BACT|nr:hypothetical protein [Fodinibius salinus]TYP95519.1 hypothetical protein LX73_0826 [Fodinibius salinus]
MAYLIFGLATGTFVCGLIEHFHKDDQSSWIKPSYLFGISGLGYASFLYFAWPLLQQVFSHF